MDEIWKDVDNTSGRYQISSNGNLRMDKDGKYKNVTPHLDTYGYQYVSIRFDNKDKAKRIALHRLVALAFINNPYNLPIVHHIDENKLNNSASNLFWCTHAQNHSFSLSARNGVVEKHREIEQYTLDGKYIATWSSYAEAYRVIKPNDKKGTSLISRCCQAKNGKKSAYGYIWKFGKGDPMYKPSTNTIGDNLNDLFETACKKSPERVREALIEIINN